MFCSNYKDFFSLKPQVAPSPIQSLSDYDSMCFFYALWKIMKKNGLWAQE